MTVMMKLILEGLVPELLRQITICNERLQETDRRNGGYLCVFDADQEATEPPLAIIRVGEPVVERAGKYFELCQEKARRLLNNPDHLSSWQTRDLENSQYGGAIRAIGCVLGFSGCVELVDEAILVNGGFFQGLVDGGTATKISHISHNELIDIY